jgi:hypothetical protein
MKTDVYGNRLHRFVIVSLKNVSQKSCENRDAQQTHRNKLIIRSNLSYFFCACQQRQFVAILFNVETIGHLLHITTIVFIFAATIFESSSFS